MTDYERLRSRHETYLEARKQPYVSPDWDAVRRKIADELIAEQEAKAQKAGMTLEEWRQHDLVRRERLAEYDRRNGVNSRNL